jgi:hypothetical protein
MGWPPESEGWEAFIEAPRGRDMYRLVEHLGLEWFDPEYYTHQIEIAARLDYPGVLLYDIFIPAPTGFEPMGTRCTNRTCVIRAGFRTGTPRTGQGWST